MDLVQALRSTGAVRAFLPEAVPDEVVHRILDTARFAPNGGNRQGWRVVVVKDPAVRRGLRDLYVPVWQQYLSMSAAGLVPFAAITDEVEEARAIAGADAFAGVAADFAEHLDEVPVLLVLLADLRCLATTDRDLDRYTLIGGASIYPFAWGVLLAARAEGLAGVITTMVTRREAEAKALLHVPDEQAVAAVIALGRPVKQPTRLKRAEVEAFTTVDTADGPTFSG